MASLKNAPLNTCKLFSSVVLSTERRTCCAANNVLASWSAQCAQNRICEHMTNLKTGAQLPLADTVQEQLEG
eukprot:CAMPEP_0180514224 /NCGR_PEP_ID=MMETSP1036_2-20121128/52608_1 /TAXON_ID=632150 /ORGANISM="Azadinium spinosum, Strain 3D9" /LENGTH=71 /DNA_ID=CAMNT_0022525617 /DNA_START=158 /DNA_END=370 /DNA_ORIENTATION=+